MYKKLWLLLLTLSILTGCASPMTEADVKIIAKKDVTYEKTLDRVLISIALDNTFFNEQEVAQSLSNRLTKHGITVKTVVSKKNPLELEKGKDLKAAIAAFKPNQVLVLAVTNAREENGTSVFFVLVGRLHDVVTNHQVWHFTYIGGRARVESNMFVDVVVQKLEDDGLLSALARQTTGPAQ